MSFFLDVTDPEGDTVTITVGNSPDGQFFTLDTSTGEIRSTQSFDFETPLDENGDNVYVQSVTLSDGTNTVSRNVTVSITNVDEAPVCDVVAPVSVDENVSGVIATLSASDPDAGDDANAVFENLSSTDLRVDPSLTIDPSSGEISLTSGLDAEAFEKPFSFEVAADYRTNGLGARCSVAVTLNDLPSQVTSGVLFDDNLSEVQSLGDLDARGVGEFWLSDAADPAGTTAGGTLLFGETLTAAIAATGGANLSLAALPATDRVRVFGSFDFGNSDRASTVSALMISDLNGDGRADLFVGADQPPNDGISLVRRPFAYVVYSSALDASGGAIDLDALTPAQGFSLTGPADLNGFAAFYSIADLDGVAGDELVISLPGAIGPGSETGKLYVVANAALVGAADNLDFDLAPTTKAFEGDVDIDAAVQISETSLLDDVDGDSVAELLLIGPLTAAVVPSANLIGSTGGVITSLDPLILDLGTDGPSSFSQADFDGDLVPDLLLTRRTDAPGRQAALLAGNALAPILGSAATVSLDGNSFAPGSLVDIVSDGIGSGPSQANRLIGLDDLDGDGFAEVAFGQFQNSANEAGPIYLLRGDALAGLATLEFDVSALTPQQGTLLTTVPRQFESISTRVSRTPDIDGDGFGEFYLTSNRRAASDPEGVALLLKSSDVIVALANEEAVVDLERLFFNETP